MQEMASIRIEDSPPEWYNIAMSEVTRGRESAIKLAIVLGELLPPPTGDQGLSSAARALVDELVGSFSKALVALGAAATKPEACRSPTGTNTGSTCDEWADVNSGGKNKAPPARRGAYRKRAHPYNWKTKTSKTIADGYTWRKYGQKEIYGAKYQRSYFRCTHKHDQGCKATRQVQQSEEDPSVYLITYMGEHTCRSDLNALPSINSPHIISFGFDACGNGSQESPVSAITTSLPSLKQEADEEVVSCSRAPGCSSLEHDFAQPDIKAQFGWAGGDVVDCGDVTSLFHSSASNSEMDVTEESFDVDELLNLDDHQDEFYYG